MAEIRPQDAIRRRELPTGPQVPPPVDDPKALSGWLFSLARAFQEHARELRKRLDEVVVGKVNWNGVFTLTDGGATATVVQDERVTPDCEISLMPLTANAASLVGKVYIPLATLLEGTAYRADPVGQFTVQHPIVAAADFTFRYSIKG